MIRKDGVAPAHFASRLIHRIPARVRPVVVTVALGPAAGIREWGLLRAELWQRV